MQRSSKCKAWKLCDSFNSAEKTFPRDFIFVIIAMVFFSPVHQVDVTRFYGLSSPHVCTAFFGESYEKI